MDGLGDLIGLAELELHTDSNVPRLTERLAALPALRELWLTAPRLTDDQLVALASSKSLQRLVLERTPVTDDGVLALAMQLNLAELKLSATQCTEAGIERLRGLLPQLAVICEP